MPNVWISNEQHHHPLGACGNADSQAQLRPLESQSAFYSDPPAICKCIQVWKLPLYMAGQLNELRFLLSTR